jgi:molybdopterin synthase sulfur carrier subunit
MTRVLLFGRLADVAGWRDRTIEPHAPTLSALRSRLTADDPVLGEALKGPGVQAAVDKALVRGDAALTAASEVAFLPPMSGG